MILTALTDIIPLMEKHSLTEIGKMLKPKRSRSVMYVYAKRLREAGYTLPPPRKSGRPKIPVDNPTEIL